MGIFEFFSGTFIGLFFSVSIALVLLGVVLSIRDKIMAPVRAKEKLARKKRWKREADEAKKVDQDRYFAKVRELEDAHRLSPTDFETLVGRLFNSLGYQVATTAATGDGGVDLILTNQGETEIVQCKRYKGNVPVQTVREFYGVMVSRRCSKGYIVTTGHFTTAGKAFAQGKGIQLIDGPELAEMLSVAQLEIQGDTPDSPNGGDMGA